MSDFTEDFELREIRQDGDTAVFETVIPPKLKYLDGHFPGAPIVPGVAQIVALGESPARQAWPDLGAAAGLRRVKFMEALRPGDTLRLTLTRRSPTEVATRIHRGEVECSKGTLLFAAPNAS